MAEMTDYQTSFNDISFCLREELPFELYTQL